MIPASGNSGPEVINLFSCSTKPRSQKVYIGFETQLSTKFQLLIKTKILINKKKFLTLSLSYIVFIMLINVKIPTIVGILTIMSRIDFAVS